MADEKLTRLADPERAIANYLDELLHTATDSALREPTIPEASAPAQETRTKAAATTRVQERKVVEKTAPDSAARESSPAPAIESPPQPVIETQKPRAVDLPVESGNKPLTKPEPDAPPSRPEWSEKPFECLIFTVAGLQLAVPLILLGAIHRIEQEVRPIPGSPRWYMGIRPDRDQNLRVVDTAEWIMAGRVPENARDNYKFVIRLDDSDWGLACDDVAQSFTLKPDDVRWRTVRSKRPWLAGTVIDQMCALIDVRTMADLLVRAEREHHLDLS
ncbi:chemotaxis protein CheW [Marinobacter sediminum]|uniref:chemotaxis protein CheW n=1 Tax=Marinobacter sediminum TaxID=256323 RepID=UPI00202FA22D|nr:chemotaxis protein CheW [Marinobacter sediminum]MCM0611553.1 chemotaxis protein CheW [Marinobacter sediminum]